MKLSRRDFLKKFTKQTGCFIALATLTPIAASSVINTKSNKCNGLISFPQGVASADPQPDAIMLWTRALPRSPIEKSTIFVQISLDDKFNQVLSQKKVISEKLADYTVRCFVTGLQPNTYYYYRFISKAGEISRLGRTKTAPENDADVTLNLAVFSCQDYEHGYFTAYKHLIERDRIGEKIDLCLHVGDYIYEWVGEKLVNLNNEIFDLYNIDGTLRRVNEFPSGGNKVKRGMTVPTTLEDYRTLYKCYLKDPDLLDARARFPFVHIWDDHEVANDYWQSYVGEKGIQNLKVVANQAWFEYLPAVLDEAPKGAASTHGAKSFTSTNVIDTSPQNIDENYLCQESNNLAAISSLGIYRSLRWGKHVDLLLVDGRSFRGQRGVDSKLLNDNKSAAYPKRPLDPQMIKTLNEGRTANNGQPPKTINIYGAEYPNPRIDSPRSTMLGAKQKQWLKDSLKNSDATWRVIGNNVPMMRFGFDTRMFENGHRSGLFWTDSWDGYPAERKELMEFITENSLTNIVSITGDRHANFAGMVEADYEHYKHISVIPEFVGASTSAQSRSAIQTILFAKEEELHSRTYFDGEQFNYKYKTGSNLNSWLLFGEETAAIMHKTLDPNQAIIKSKKDVNPHLSYADVDAFGYYTMKFSATKIDTKFIVLAEPVTIKEATEPTVRRIVNIEMHKWNENQKPTFNIKKIEGEQVILGVKNQASPDRVHGNINVTNQKKHT
jgi:alkaline phosphatase D